MNLECFYNLDNFKSFPTRFHRPFGATLLPFFHEKLNSLPFFSFNLIFYFPLNLNTNRIIEEFKFKMNYLDDNLEGVWAPNFRGNGNLLVQAKTTNVLRYSFLMRMSKVLSLF